MFVSNWGHAERLKEWRESLRLKQSEVAGQLKMSRGGYANYEAGTAPIPDDRLSKLREMGYGQSAKSPPPEEPDAEDALKNKANVIAFPAYEMPYAGLVPAGEWSDPFESTETREVDPSVFRETRW